MSGIASGTGRADSKEALWSAAQAAVQEVRRKRPSSSERRHSSRVILMLLSGLFFALSIYLLAARPAWFFTPDPPAETLAIQEASARLMLVREAERVREFWRENGRLPRTLVEAGSATSGVSYRHDREWFVLSAPVGGGMIELTSDDTVAAFLGTSMAMVRRRGR